METPLSEELVGKAVRELIKHTNRAQASKAARTLIEDHATPISVQFQLMQESSKVVIRPIRVKIPHSMFSTEEDGHSICLFCRSEDKDKLVEHFKSHPFEGLTSIISLGEVNKQYKAFREKKDILSNHTHFVCDIGIVSHLYNLLGKTFGQRNHFPVPITISLTEATAAAAAGKKNPLHVNIQQVVDSTYMALKGQHINVRFGNTRMPAAHVTENIVQGVAFAVENKIPNGWKNVHSLHIKTPTSASLPLYYRHSKDIMNLLSASATQAPTPLPVPAPAATPAPVAAATKTAATPKTATAKAAKQLAAAVPAAAKATKSAAAPTPATDVWPPAPPAPVHATKQTTKPIEQATAARLLKQTASSAAKTGKVAAAPAEKAAAAPASAASSSSRKRTSAAAAAPEIAVEEDDSGDEEVVDVASPALTRSRKAAKLAATTAAPPKAAAATKSSAAKSKPKPAAVPAAEPAAKKQKRGK